MNDILVKIGEYGLVPVIKIDQAKDAIPLGRALVDGGLPVAEVTFRTAAAEAAIRALSEQMPELLLGAGTVLKVDQVKQAVAAGAKFIVTPGFNPKVVDYCLEHGIPITPGTNNPTTIEMALEKNLEVVKFFPAEESGGLKALKSMSAPYGGVRFVPTGGINANNLASYLAFDRIHACGGSWMVDAKLINEGRFDEITRRVREAVGLVLGFELRHVGINAPDAGQARDWTNRMGALFLFPPKEGGKSFFAGTGFEIMKSPFLGAHGHLAIATPNVDRAIAWMKRQGVGILVDTVDKDAQGTKVAYLDLDLGGFAVHLIRK